MKATFTFLFLLFFVAGGAFGQTPDETAIKATIRRETLSYFAADAKAWRDCWAALPESNNLYYSEQSHKVGQTSMATPDLTIVANRKPTQIKIETSREQFRINGNTAFVQYDQHATREDGAQDYSHQTRYLEKVNGAWKIIHVGSVSYKFEAGTK
ncbi:hypothetical protein ACS5NO_31990 [Larkinella sp. GY13]|uniref:hypothetical protein n=1 Tax=Larkinella sp. GY13 TaxID=3453720 RepID=UPI003EEB1EDD